jgi:hypothetical protein
MKKLRRPRVEDRGSRIASRAMTRLSILDPRPSTLQAGIFEGARDFRFFYRFTIVDGAPIIQI